jgi:hypothetical protein
MLFNIKFWLKLSLINLLIVAILGVLMRYKIGFEFPYFSQKNIQHAHSHFAFAGWITHALYVLMIHFILKLNQQLETKNYKRIIIANLICSYGMLITFFYQGYGLLSIILSTSTIIIACLFIINYLRDLKTIDNSNPAKAWFKAALWFNIISSVGTFYLAYMMATRNFTCLGLFFSECTNIFPEFKYDKLFFKLFYASIIPAYFLSILWAKLPVWLYIIVIIAAIIQVFAWVKIIVAIKTALKSGTILNKFQTYLFLFVGIAFSIKLVLQLGSTIPGVGDLAFGFRPIVIAYLHLVLLAVVSVFILAYLYTFKLILINKLTAIALILFIIGIFLNELVLAIQGIAAFSYIVVKYVNETLFGISLLLLIGILLMVVSQRKKLIEL